MSSGEYGGKKKISIRSACSATPPVSNYLSVCEEGKRQLYVAVHAVSVMRGIAPGNATCRIRSGPCACSSRATSPSRWADVFVADGERGEKICDTVKLVSCSVTRFHFGAFDAVTVGGIQSVALVTSTIFVYYRSLAPGGGVSRNSLRPWLVNRRKSGVGWPRKKRFKHKLEPFVFLVGRAGLEPATNGLKVRCSTN